MKVIFWERGRGGDDRVLRGDHTGLRGQLLNLVPSDIIGKVM